MRNVKTSFDLNQIKIASPCHEDWAQMTGDDRARRCAACKLDVFNVSEMTKGEAEAMILSGLTRGRVCVKLMRRHDGTVITKDCPVGVSRVRKFRMKVASVAFSLFAGVFAAVGDASNRAFGGEETKGRIALPMPFPMPMPMMGDIAEPTDQTLLQPSPTAHEENDQPYRFEEQ